MLILRFTMSCTTPTGVNIDHNSLGVLVRACVSARAHTYIQVHGVCCVCVCVLCVCVCMCVCVAHMCVVCVCVSVCVACVCVWCVCVCV